MINEDNEDNVNNNQYLLKVERYSFFASILSWFAFDLP